MTARMQSPRVVPLRDGRLEDHVVIEGAYIVLGPNDGLIASHSDRTAAVHAGMGKLNHGFELVTLYCGIPAGNDAHRVAVEVLGSAV